MTFSGSPIKRKKHDLALDIKSSNSSTGRSTDGMTIISSEHAKRDIILTQVETRGYISDLSANKLCRINKES